MLRPEAGAATYGQAQVHAWKLRLAVAVAIEASTRPELEHVVQALLSHPLFTVRVHAARAAAADAALRVVDDLGQAACALAADVIDPYAQNPTGTTAAERDIASALEVLGDVSTPATLRQHAALTWRPRQALARIHTLDLGAGAVQRCAESALLPELLENTQVADVRHGQVIDQLVHAAPRVSPDLAAQLRDGWLAARHLRRRCTPNQVEAITAAFAKAGLTFDQPILSLPPGVNGAGLRIRDSDAVELFLALDEAAGDRPQVWSAMSAVLDQGQRPKVAWGALIAAVSAAATTS